MDELPGRNANLPATREAWSAAWIAIGVIGGPFLLTMLSLLFVYSLGFGGTDVAKAVFWSCAFTSYVILLPLAAGLAVRSRERKQEIAGEMMAFFSHRVTTLYALAEEDAALSADSRTAEVFEIYSWADWEIEENVQNPLLACETIEHGVFLADELLAAHKAREG